jgi:hypothetical protein
VGANLDCWLPYDGHPIADVLRDQATEALVARVDQEILAPWRATHAADPTSPSPADVSLALNPWWWTSINAATLEVEEFTPDVDPLGRLGATDPCTAAMLPWLRRTIAAIRADSLRIVARSLIDVLATGELRLAGIRKPAADYGGDRTDVPVAMLKSREWLLRSDNVRIENGTGANPAIPGAQLTPAL